MFEKRSRLHIGFLLETHLNRHNLEQDVNASFSRTVDGNRLLVRSTNERNMTRKTRSRQLHIHSVFQSGYCEVCHIDYQCFERHVRSKTHRKLVDDEAQFLPIKGFNSLFALDAIDSPKSYLYFLEPQSNNMPRTRTGSVLRDRVKAPLSPVGNDSGHRLRSRKNINYMTPPLEEDSLPEKPEPKDFRELRSSSRLLAKLADQIVESDEVWNSGRPKRACNRNQRISTDEVADNKSFYNVDVVSSKLRSSVAPLYEDVEPASVPDEPKPDDKGLLKFRKLRNSELIRLNTEAVDFLFPKKDDSSDEDEKVSRNETSSINSDAEVCVKVEDEDSMHSGCSDGSKSKKKRRTHAEAFILDNQKYYKFETPGSRLRYQGSYLSPVPPNGKNEDDSDVKSEFEDSQNGDFSEATLNLKDYQFSFESVPEKDPWYRTFHRKDVGEEKYAYLSDDSYWDSLVLPYQLKYIPPLDPQECISHYNHVKKCLMEPSSSASDTCSTPDPTASNSSSDHHEEEIKTSPAKRGRPRIHPLPQVSTPTSGKNPRKSPRQHASTLAILSSLIHQRKRKSKGVPSPKAPLPRIEEEPVVVRSPPKKPKVDYFAIAKSVEEEFANLCEDTFSELDFSMDEEISLKGKFDVEELFKSVELEMNEEDVGARVVHAKPGRKPGKRKKNRTGWPMNRVRRSRRKEEEVEDVCDESAKTDVSINEESVMNSENNNKNDQNNVGLSDEDTMNCDLNNEELLIWNDKCEDASDKVLTTKVNNSGDFNLQYQPYVRVQKLAKKHTDSKNESAKRSNSPKRTNRGQRRMPASPKSPRMLRRPRGRWYRER